MKDENSAPDIEIKHLRQPSELSNVHLLQSTEKLADLNSSRAISAAMQALQTRVKHLESENLSLHSEKESLSFSCQQLSSKVQLLEYRTEELQSELKDSSSNRLFYEEKCKHLQQTLSERRNIDRQVSSEEINDLKLTIDKLKEALRGESEEKEYLKNKLGDLNQIAIQLTQQLELSSNKLENHNHQEINDIRKLTSHIKSQDQLIEELRNQLIAKENTIQSFKKRTDSELYESKRHRSNSKRRRSHCSLPAQTFLLKKEDERASLQQEIKDLNKMYRNLLQQAYSEKTDLATVRQELNSIADLIDQKNTCLKNL